MYAGNYGLNKQGKNYMIKLDCINKSYGTARIIKDLSFEVQDKETLVLLGKSGCGKTTLLKMINRLIALDSGNIYVDGTNIMDVNPIELRRSIGYVFQNIGLLPHYTIRRNLCVVPHLLKWEESRIKKQLEMVCDVLKIDTTYLQRMPRQLSGGQRQRIGVGRALMSNPNIVLMDEPFGALDPITRQDIQDEFSSLKHLIHKTIVFVTHDVHEAFILGDRICLMDGGNIAQIGTKTEILEQPASEFVEKFMAKYYASVQQGAV